MSNRIFSEDEVQQLIKRAAELEVERNVPGRSSQENGLTIDELKKIASETGLDPQLIEQAAAEMDTSGAKSKEKEQVRVNRKEIASETWLDCQPDKETTEALITELNHMYGTTDELNWWDNLWGTHEGKAKVTRTPSTTEWNYKTEAGAYSTRVLMQRRGERFRIRVSKRQIMDLEWNSAMNSLIFAIPLAVLLAVFGGIASSNLLGTEWPGITTGLLLSMLSYPLLRRFSKRSLEKHKAEVANTTRQLSDLVLQSTGYKKNEPSAKEQAKSTSEIEIPDEPETEQTKHGKLRNNLRE